MPMITGSDTRMYSPRSESNLGYTKDDDDYKYGVGDPKEMDKLRDKKQSKKERGKHGGWGAHSFCFRDSW